MAEPTWEVLDEAYAALRAAVANVPSDSWSHSTPCGDWTVAQVLHHAAGDQLGYVMKLGKGPGPDYDPFSPSTEKQDNPITFLETALTAGAAAFADVDPADTEVPVPLPPFVLPASRAVEAAALDAAIHAWDIAVATGQPSPLTPELAIVLRPVADELVEPLRGFAFGPAIEPDRDADAATALLNYLGRRVPQ
ncbi:MAG: TIGR03086 family protein [Corynebacteriales bacterium]|nr:TIGR03086 family protein [Mycobacteriales bacterium]